MSKMTEGLRKELGIRKMRESGHRSKLSISVPTGDVIDWTVNAIDVLHHLVLSRKMGPEEMLSALTHVFKLKPLAEACRALADELDEYITEKEMES